jgi:GNAT superfamily N-acetyltransferase
MEYRLADSHDSDRLAELRWAHKNEDASQDGGTPLDAAEREGFIRTCSDFLKQALQEEFFCWVAVDNKVIVSHIYVVRVRKVPKPGKLDGIWGYVTAVFTVPDYRNKGVGSSLMEQVKAWGREKGLENLIVWPSERAVPFYERAGFSSETDVLELPLEG